MADPRRTVSVVVPIHAPLDHELPTIARCLDGLLASAAAQVIVAEQVSSCGESPLRKWLDPWGKRLTYLQVVSGERAMHRSRLCNEAAVHATGDYLWLHDAHLILPFFSIIEELGGASADFVKPFGAYVKLSKHDTTGFLEGGSLDDPLIRNSKRLGTAVGKSSYGVDREVYLRLRGLNEDLVGASDEGFELVRRLRKLFREVRIFEQHTGAMLYRAPRSDDDSAVETGKLLRDSMGAAVDEDVHAFVQGMRSSLGFDGEALRRLAIRRQRDRATARVDPTPPPRFPKRLPGTLWGLTTYFNPSGYATKRDNYDRFRRASREQGLDLLTVELAFEDRPFELQASDCELLIQLRSDAVLWHKERLLTLGLKHLPEHCDKVAWLDADVLFENEDWVARTARALETHVMVQPFTMSVRLARGETWIDLDGLPVGSGEHEVLQGMAYGVSRKGYGCLGSYLDHGHSGYAWAGRRDVLAEHGFYEANILGNGDLNIALAMFGGADYVSKTRFSDKARKHLEAWARRFHGDVRGSVGYVEGVVRHLWHGNKRDRLYDVRLTVLKDHDFDPDNDLGYDDAGVLRWKVDKPGLRDWCRRYFEMRKEG